MAEHTGLVAVVATLVLALAAASSGHGRALAGTVGCVVERLATGDAAGGRCGEPAPPEPGDGPTALVRAAAGPAKAAAPEAVRARRAAPPRRGETVDDTPLAGADGRLPDASRAAAGRRARLRAAEERAPYYPGYQRPRFWDVTKCHPRTGGPGCPPPVSVPRLLNGRADPESQRLERKLVLEVERVQDWHYRRFGWSGIDGKGSPVEIEAHAVDEAGIPYAAAFERPNRILVGDVQMPQPDNDYWMVHEFTHGINVHFLEGLGWATDPKEAWVEGAINEGFATMAADEAIGDFSPLDFFYPAPVRWRCPGPDVSVHDDGEILVTVHREIAGRSGTWLMEVGGESRYVWGWNHAARLRWDVISRTLPARYGDGTVTFGEVRGAYLESAAKVGVDRTIVERAFNRQGITSEAWEPPPCDYSFPWA